VIASLRGELIVLSTSGCVVDVGGVGYSVALTPDHSRTLHVGDTVTFSTTLIVREDSMQLFGFASTVEQSIFEALLTVSGIGPRSALAVLSQLSPSEIYSAVIAEDDAPFRKVSGIGPKTAKLVVVSLAGRLTHLVDGADAAADLGDSAPRTTTDNVTAQVIAALRGLGWNEKTASDVVQRLRAGQSDIDAAALLRGALSELGSAGVGS
jgi:Holliday junction DNA helicase RuvA